MERSIDVRIARYKSLEEKEIREYQKKGFIKAITIAKIAGGKNRWVWEGNKKIRGSGKR